MHRTWPIIFLIPLALLAFGKPSPALAQDAQPPAVATNQLTLFTAYPGEVVGIGESATLNLTLQASSVAQTVQLEMKQIPDGWTATFQGGGHIVDSVYVEPGKDATVSLRLDQPANVKPGTYNFDVLAKSQNTQVDLPIELTIKSKLPPKLSMTTQLPTLQGSPSTTFRYNVSLKNEGDEDLNITMSANAPSDFQMSYTLSGQEVTSFPLPANQTKQVSVEAKPVSGISAGNYPITVNAQGGDAQANLDLTAQVTGQSQLTVTSPDGNLSGQAYAGKSSSINVVVRNTGTAPAQGIQLSASPPSGWNVTFSPQAIADIPAGQQVQVTANIQPTDKAVAGDYMVTVKAQPSGGSSQSADFRITVLTSTLWGIAGIALIAVALGVVALAVVRFGRR